MPLIITPTSDNSRPKRIVTSNVQLSHTGTTSETTIYTGTIPANSIGANGHFDISTLYSMTNSANAKTIKIKFNGTSIMTRTPSASQASERGYTQIFNRNSLSAQVASGVTAGQAFILGLSTLAPSTHTFDTSADITVTVTFQLATSSETISLEAFTIIAYP